MEGYSTLLPKFKIIRKRMEIMTRKKEHKLKKLSILLVLIMLFTIAITGCSKEKEDEKIEEIEEIIEDRAIKFDRSDVKKQVVYDDEDVKVTITGMGYGGKGPELYFDVENNTDMDIKIGFRCATVNDTVVDMISTSVVRAGEKAEGEVMFMYEEELLEKDISVMKDMEFKIAWWDNNKELPETGGFWAYNLSEINKIEFDYINEMDESKKWREKIYESDDIEVYVYEIEKIDSDLFHKEAVKINVVNKTSKDVEIETTNIKINGRDAGGYYGGAYVPAGKNCDSIIHLTDVPDDEEIKIVSMQLEGLRYIPGYADIFYEKEKVFVSEVIEYTYDRN